MYKWCIEANAHDLSIETHSQVFAIQIAYELKMCELWLGFLLLRLFPTHFIRRLIARRNVCQRRFDAVISTTRIHT